MLQFDDLSDLEVKEDPTTGVQVINGGLIDESIWNLDTLLTAKIPQIEKLLSWLPLGGLAMVTVMRGLGKTFFAINLAVAVASGRNFMKWAVTRPSGVLYIDGEMPVSDYRERLGGFITDKPIMPILTLNHEAFFKNREMDLDLSDPALQEQILKFLDNNPLIKLVILDNLSSLVMIREDKSDDWRDLFRPFLLRCRRRGVAVMIVHHTNKSGEQRGTGAREDHLDTSIVLRPVNDECNDGAHFKVEFTKSRGVYGEEVEPFSAKLGKDSEGHFEWVIGDADGKVRTRLVKLIREYGSDGITVTEAAEELGVTKSAVSKARAALISDGDIKPGKRMKFQ